MSHHAASLPPSGVRIRRIPQHRSPSQSPCRALGGHAWANALEEKEAKELYERFHVAGSGIALVQMGNANLNPRTEAKVDTINPDRGPLLIIEIGRAHV